MQFNDQSVFFFGVAGAWKVALILFYTFSRCTDCFRFMLQNKESSFGTFYIHFG